MSDITNLNLFSGDSISWNEELEDYPVTTHTIKYLLQKTSEAPTVTTHAVVGAEHKLTLTVPATGGRYKFQKKAVLISDDSETTLDFGYKDITASLASGTDNRSHNRKVLEALRSALLGRATKEQSSIQISGRAIQYLTLAELHDTIKIYEAEVAAEERIENGQSAVPQILDEIGSIT